MHFEETAGSPSFYPPMYYADYFDGIESPTGVLAGGHSLWQYTGGTWVLKNVEAQPGFQQGAPPLEPGAFEGHLKRTPCRRVGVGT